MAVDWNDKYLPDFHKELGDNLEKAAVWLKGDIIERVNRSQPYKIYGKSGRWYRGLDPSLPGESPKKVRGDLQKSYSHVVDRKGLEAKVGTNVDYAFFLEIGTANCAARPHFRPALIEGGDTITNIILTGKK